jgi:hypothetical protein
MGKARKKTTNAVSAASLIKAGKSRAGRAAIPVETCVMA